MEHGFPSVSLTFHPNGPLLLMGPLDGNQDLH